MAKSHIVKTIFRGLIKSTQETAHDPVHQLKETLDNYFQTETFPVNSGRSAIYLLLKAMKIGEGDEVIIQAYTCNAVPNPIVWTGATPVYADIDINTLNVDPAEIEKKISSKTKAIILQHTLGRPGPIEEVLEIAKRHKIWLIEDCAHSLGASYKGKKLGTFGDAAIISFGREKVISSLAGGAILVNREKLLKSVIQLISGLQPMKVPRVLSEFFNFATWRVLLRRFYFTSTGRNMIKELNKHDFFNVVTSQKEYRGEKPDWYPAGMPNVLAEIALEEFGELDRYNKARKEIAEYYFDKITNPSFKLLTPHEGVYLRVPALHPDATRILEEAKRREFWFGYWYNWPVFPKGVDEEKLGYKQGMCPKAEEAARQTINIPNYLGISIDEASRVAEFINNWS